ncbi:MAG: hemolysin III family protein [Pseudomonadales bacterium]|nr:hemolysin III family protein [Pseudomonadales bacterium]
MDRAQTLGEEIANAVSHGCGALAAIAAIPLLTVHYAATGRGPVDLFAVSLFGSALVVLYLASTLYHALPDGSAKRVFRVLDHSAIYVLIAGSYTPFALGVFRESWGWSVFALIWALAGMGILLKSTGRASHPWLSSGLYLAMGWLALAFAEPLFSELPAMGLFWIIAGGAAYTLGVIFFALDERLRYAHFTWHLFVLAGSVCHFVAVYAYA